MKLQDLNLAHL